MPLPLSVTASMTYCPGTTSVWVAAYLFVEIHICGFNRQLAAVRHRIAGIHGEIEHGDFKLVLDRRGPATSRRPELSPP